MDSSEVFSCVIGVIYDCEGCDLVALGRELKNIDAFKLNVTPILHRPGIDEVSGRCIGFVWADESGFQRDFRALSV